MKRFLLFLLAYILVSTTLAQNRCSYFKPRHAENWLFSTNVWLNINGNTSIRNMPENIISSNGSGVWSDANGEMIMYSDGLKVWNKDHEMIYQGLLGNLGSLQPALFVPAPGNNNILYLFTTDILTSLNPVTKGVNYYKIDIQGNGGKGQVISTDHCLLSDAVPVIAATSHSSEDAYWILTHRHTYNEFCAYKLSAQGIDDSPVVSKVGLAISPNYQTNEYVSMLKFSPKGDKLAMISFGKAEVKIFNFDKATGKVSFHKQIDISTIPAILRPYSGEFSADGSKFYLTLVNGNTQNPRDNILMQYDLNNIFFSTQLNVTLSQDIWALQLASDGKIYVTRKNNFYMGIIENPDRAGLDCNFKDQGLYLEGARGLSGLPNFVSDFVNVAPVDFDTKCHGDVTTFTLLNTSNIDNVEWNFGDPNSTENLLTTNAGEAATHIFTEPGDYTVTYKINYQGKSWTPEPVGVTIHPLPENSFKQHFPNDTAYIMKDGSSSIQLWAQEDMYSYEWSPDGSTNISYVATEEGVCSLTVEDMNCCRLKSDLNIVKLDPKIPNAFKRSSSIIENTIFKPKAPPDGVADYSMKIYDKWGRLLFETKDINTGWDGKVNSSPAPEGLYVWYIVMNVARNQMNKGMFKLSGTVMLLD